MFGKSEHNQSEHNRFDEKLPYCRINIQLELIILLLSSMFLLRHWLSLIKKKNSKLLFLFIFFTLNDLLKGKTDRRYDGKVLAKRRPDGLLVHVGPRNDGLGVARGRLGPGDADPVAGLGRGDPSAEEDG